MRWRYRFTVLVLCMLAFFGTMVARLGISPVVPEITDEFAVSNTRIGLALTGMWIAYAMSQFPSGILADRFGERSVILLAVGGTVVASIMLALAPVFAVFALCVILIGAAAGLHYTPATSLLSRMFVETGTALGAHNLGGPLAGLLTPVAVVWVAARYGWRPAVALAVVVALPVFLLIVWRVEPVEPQRPDQPMREQLLVGSMVGLLARPAIIFTIAIAILHLFAWQGLASFLPTFLIEHRGYSAALAGVLFSAYFVIQGIMGIGVGAISDRFGRDIAIAGCMVAAIAGLLLSVEGGSLATVTLGIGLLGIGMSGYPPILARFVDAFDDQERGVGIGIVRTTSGTIGASGSFGVGFFADAFNWTVSFGVLAAMLVVVLLLLGCNRAFRLGY